MAKSEDESRSRNRKMLWWIAGVIVAAMLPYVLSLGGGFALDDVGLILQYPLAQSLAHLPEAFTKSFLPGAIDPDVVYYRPLVTASYQANYMIAGPDPFVFRLFNLLLHVITSLLVFALARRVTRSLTAAGIAGMAFGVLPSHYEAVSWIAGRTDLMSSLFTLGAVLVFAGFCDASRNSDPPARNDRPARSDRPAHPRAGRPHLSTKLIACALLTLCALFSKENAVVLPLLALGYAWAFLCRMSRADKIKWAAALIIPMVVFVLARRHAVHVTVVTHPTLVLGRRILGVGIAYAAYLRMLLVPQVGKVVYDVFPIGMKYPLISLAAWLVPVGLVALALRLRKQAPVIAFGSLWVFLSLLPVANILPATSPIPAERFVYLASIGSAVVLGWLAKLMLDWRPGSIRVWPAVSIAIVCWYMLYCTALTIQSTPQYSSDIAWARAVSAINGRFYRPWAGYYFYKAGFFKEAAREYEAAVKYSPKDVGNYLGVANARRALGQPAKAIEVLLEARERFGPSASVELSLATSYAQARDLPDADKAFSRAVQLDPRSAAAWTGLARASLRLAKYKEAVRAYGQAASMADLGVRDRFEFGLACEGAGLVERAVREYRWVAAHDPQGKLGEEAARRADRLRP